MLLCNSIIASIWGLAVSWKYNPQGWGASQRWQPNCSKEFNGLKKVIMKVWLYDVDWLGIKENRVSMDKCYY